MNIQRYETDWEGDHYEDHDGSFVFYRDHLKALHETLEGIKELSEYGVIIEGAYNSRKLNEHIDKLIAEVQRLLEVKP